MAKTIGQKAYRGKNHSWEMKGWCGLAREEKTKRFSDMGQCIINTPITKTLIQAVVSVASFQFKGMSL